MDAFLNWLAEYSVAVFMPLAITFVISFLIGFERQNIGKSAGISPHVLVAMSSCAIAMLQMFLDFESTGSTQRIVAQVVSGIGFLGAGVIMKSENRIKGLTTATTLWTSAIIGIVIGCKSYDIGITFGVFVVGFMYIRDLHRKINPFRDQSKPIVKKREHNDLK